MKPVLSVSLLAAVNHLFGPEAAELVLTCTAAIVLGSLLHRWLRGYEL